MYGQYRASSEKMQTECIVKQWGCAEPDGLLIQVQDTAVGWLTEATWNILSITIWYTTSYKKPKCLFSSCRLHWTILFTKTCGFRAIICAKCPCISKNAQKKFGPWPLHNRLHKYFHKMVDFSHSHNINFLFYILIFLDKLGKIYMLTKFWQSFSIRCQNIIKFIFRRNKKWQLK